MHILIFKIRTADTKKKSDTGPLPPISQIHYLKTGCYSTNYLQFVIVPKQTVPLNNPSLSSENACY
jgi:hypothetical protein